MKKIVLITVIIILVIFLIGFYLINNSEYEEEYIPQEEISDNDLRNTIITLYFENTENGEVQTEARLIDSKELLQDPYSYLINLLIEGPKNTSLRRVIPEGTELKNVTLIGECLTINFSKEFIDNAKGDALEKSNLIYTIVNTLTELKDVSRIKILIEDNESDGFSDVGISFKNEFMRLN